MTPPLPPASAARAREIGAMIPGLIKVDLVYAVMPDGDEFLIKGRKRLSEIANGSASATVTRSKVGLPEIEAAVALEQLLGGDGDIAIHTFGNTLYGTAGSA